MTTGERELGGTSDTADRPGETKVELTLPEAFKLDEAGLAHWFPHLDGKWTEQTKGLIRRSGATGLDLNWNWFETPVDWRCTCCGRDKPGIVRLLEGGVLLAHLHLHHDHMRDYVGGRLNERFGIPWAKGVPLPSRHAGDHMQALVTRFRDTMVCDGCNTAEGEAKRTLGLPRHFSFSPSEMAGFIRPHANTMNEVDVDAASGIWLDARAAYEDRLAFADTLVDRLATGLFAVERNVNSVPLIQPSTFNAFLGRHALRQAPIRQLNTWLSRIWGDLRERSLSRDGVGKSSRPRRIAKVRHPTDAEFAAFEAKPARAWERTPTDWSCPCCGRGKRAILRLGKTGSWFGQIRIHPGVNFETDAGNMAFRRDLYPEHLERPVVASRWQRYICSDCGDVASKLQTIRPDLGVFTLTLEDIQDCLGEVRDNERTEIDLERAAERAENNSDLQRAESEFEYHRDLAMHLWEVYGRFGPAAREKARDALVTLARASGVESEHAPGGLGWLLRQGRAFASAPRSAPE
ncbi:hypothetical protein IPV08_10695 [Methylobacterium sp. SD274]|uniref:hypothetical protein n=1 Tax=Methylobacterium sp. SD274 TaxID=2782009 RepID=UPI001A95D999|nr:hypothetical protein [Methylobacterium sp. SD274]MBO1020436.1 hypothetical protein [Methylobacterium sp. SD274]